MVGYMITKAKTMVRYFRFSRISFVKNTTDDTCPIG